MSVTQETDITDTTTIESLVRDTPYSTETKVPPCFTSVAYRVKSFKARHADKAHNGAAKAATMLCKAQAINTSIPASNAQKDGAGRVIIALGCFEYAMLRVMPEARTSSIEAARARPEIETSETTQCVAPELSTIVIPPCLPHFVEAAVVFLTPRAVDELNQGAHAEARASVAAQAPVAAIRRRRRSEGVLSTVVPSMFSPDCLGRELILSYPHSRCVVYGAKVAATDLISGRERVLW